MTKEAEQRNKLKLAVADAAMESHRIAERSGPELHDAFLRLRDACRKLDAFEKECRERS